MFWLIATHQTKRCIETWKFPYYEYYNFAILMELVELKFIEQRLMSSHPIDKLYKKKNEK